jgi:hypothetical protein
VKRPAPPEPDQFIGAEGTEPVGEPRRSGEARRRDIDEMLDAALACTFPASDPIGCIRIPDESCSNDEE